MRADGTPRSASERDGGPMGGAVFIEDCKWKSTATVHDEPARLREGRPTRQWEISGKATAGSPGHISRIGSIASSRAARPNADVEIAIARSGLPLGEHHCELDRKLTWDPVAEKFVGDDRSNKLLDRPRRARRFRAARSR